MKKSSNKRMKFTEEVKDDKSQSSSKKRNQKASAKNLKDLINQRAQS
jgi:hypothetical protein